jgi:hypothetical protein
MELLQTLRLFDISILLSLGFKVILLSNSTFYKCQLYKILI